MPSPSKGFSLVEAGENDCYKVKSEMYNFVEMRYFQTYDRVFRKLHKAQNSNKY